MLNLTNGRFGKRVMGKMKLNLVQFQINGDREKSSSDMEPLLNDTLSFLSLIRSASLDPFTVHGTIIRIQNKRFVMQRIICLCVYGTTFNQKRGQIRHICNNLLMPTKDSDFFSFFTPNENRVPFNCFKMTTQLMFTFRFDSPSFQMCLSLIPAQNSLNISTKKQIPC